LGGELPAGALEHLAADVDRHVGGPPGGGPGVEQVPRLRRRAGAELDERRRAGALADVARVRAQDRRLGARQIIFRRLRDAVEELGPALVVEEARAEPAR